jgi:hypothetical protein
MREWTVQRACVRQLEPVRRPGQPVMHELFGLRYAHPFDGHRHDDAGQARARLAHDQGVHRAAGPGELGGQIGKPGGHARRDWIAPELGPELGVDEQPFDQLARARVVAISG